MRTDLRTALLRTSLFLVLYLSLIPCPQAATIAQWDFNSVPPDNNTSTGTKVPNLGSGVIQAAGGASEAYQAGSSRDSAPSADNTALNLSSFPSQGTFNKTDGLQVNVSTKGYENVTVSWEQRASGSLSRYFRFQYTADGSNYTDHSLISITNASVFLSFSNNLSGISALRDNPNFGFRILAEWESTAVGGTNTNYVAVSGNYSPVGATRFDLLTVRGTPIPGGNTTPTISSLISQTTRVNTASSPNPFTIGDFETASGNLMVTATSSNLTLVDTTGIVFGGNASNRTVTVTPKPSQLGTTAITITVADPGGLSASRTFFLTVLPANTPPTITPITTQSTTVNTPVTNLAFTIFDLETPVPGLTLTATSSNPSLIPEQNISLTATASNYILRLVPTFGQSGVSVITLQVSDGFLSTNTVFAVNVTPSAGVLLYDPFEYPDGSLTQHSGQLWNPHSGSPFETLLTSGQLEISSINTEDFDASLRGQPYTNGVLYAKLTITLTALPSNAEGNYFTHFNGSSNFRGRLFASTLGAADGSFRFGISNGGTNSTTLNRDLSPGTPYTVVVRYNISTATTTLWVDPTSEAEPSVTATDSANPVTIRAFSFRQAIGFGILQIDDLTVGTSFAALFGSTPDYTLQIKPAGNNTWQITFPTEATAAGYILEGTPSLVNPTWQLVSEQVTSANGMDRITLTNPTGTRFFRLRK